MRKIFLFTMITVVSTAIQLIHVLPWWTFIAGLLLLALLIPLKRWQVSPFKAGFLSGFMVWLGATIFFSMIFKGEIVHVTAELMMVPSFLLITLVGIIGGLLSGLALETGTTLRAFIIKEK